LLLFYCFSGHVSPFASILTGLKVGEEDLKYYDLTKLEDFRYGIFYFHFASQYVTECLF